MVVIENKVVRSLWLKVYKCYQNIYIYIYLSAGNLMNTLSEELEVYLTPIMHKINLHSVHHGHLDGVMSATTNIDDRLLARSRQYFI